MEHKAPDIADDDPRVALVAKALIETAVKEARERLDLKTVGFDDAADVLFSLLKESDAGLVVLSTSYVDSCFTDAFKKNLINLTSDAEDVLFGGTGPFATFSAKIRTAHALGWISRSVSNDLHILRRIRNTFAHDPYKTSLDHSDIARQIRNMPSREIAVLNAYREKGHEIKLSLRTLFMTRIAMIFFESMKEMFLLPLAREHRISPAAIAGTFED